MQIIAASKSDSDVSSALKKTISEINEELKKVNGKIMRIACDATAGPVEASVSIIVFIDGDAPVKKEIIGVNEKSYTREKSIKKANLKINELLKDKHGSIVDYYIKTMTTLPTRVYTTMIVAVNLEELEELKADVSIRRQRLKKAIELLGNDPATINIAEIAKLFGVSRQMIYKDLEALGYIRHGREKSK